MQFFSSESAHDIFCLAKSTPETAARVGRNAAKRSRHLERQLSRQVVPLLLEDEIDALANVLRDRDLRLVVQLLELLALLGRDVDGRRDLLPRHDGRDDA